MIIGIDGNEANVDQHVGVSVYTHNLLTYFQSHASKETQFVVYLREEPKSRLPKATEFYRYEIVKGPMLWSQIFLPLNLNTKRSINVFFAPAHYSPRYCPVPLVVTIHDLAFFDFPQEFLAKDLYKLKNWTKYSIEKASKIISVSKTTKKDILKHYEVPDKKVEVVYNGFEKEIPDNFEARELNEDFTQMEKKYDLKAKSYILYVGTLQPRKNITTLINGFYHFKKTNPEFKLVIAGKKGWMYENVFKEVEELGLSNDIVFPGFLPDEDIITLYKHAFCFVMPSLYEGFGIPVLEAMSHGCPVISSYASSLPEVGGEASMYFDPTNADDLAHNLHILNSEKGLREELVKKGHERVKSFSWNKCAEETLKVILNTV